MTHRHHELRIFDACCKSPGYRHIGLEFRGWYVVVPRSGVGYLGKCFDHNCSIGRYGWSAIAYLPDGTMLYAERRQDGFATRALAAA